MHMHAHMHVSILGQVQELQGKNSLMLESRVKLFVRFREEKGLRSSACEDRPCQTSRLRHCCRLDPVEFSSLIKLSLEHSTA